ncbi:anti-sigma factor [Fodinibius sediminis]|uniref:Regulator of SigK n=1 Tax=Fodinibius sediminis TaxID=1214077 RepID=A0A521E0Q3_9BACT|nr:anti-sigma factor [Fodinibius sediminis]SMO77462.1 Anti-sigma-K factor RskA [Fodinibius sediminis]
MANEEPHNEKFEELCAGYVLNALDEDERKEFEEMLAEATEEQRKLYRDLWSTAHQLAFTVEEHEPPESLKKRLMDRIQMRGQEDEAKEASSVASAVGETEIEEDERSFSWASFSAAAAFALLIVSLSLLFYSFNLSSQINNKESVIADQEVKITELEDELQRKEEMLAILESRDVDMVLMSGLEINPNGFGKVIWDTENQQALLQVSNLPPIPTDKDYQLWLIRNNEPVSAGVFAVNDSSDTFFKIEEMVQADSQSANAFAITMEPKGGMPQPTGDMYLLGNMDTSEEE